MIKYTIDITQGITLYETLNLGVELKEYINKNIKFNIILNTEIEYENDVIKFTRIDDEQ